MIKYPSQKREFKEFRMGGDADVVLDGGLNIQSQETAIKSSQSPYMLNMNSDDRGTLIKRLGQANVYTNTIGSGGCNGVYPKYKGYTIIAHGTKLYKQQSNNDPVEIHTGLANAKACFFVFNGKLYMLNGTDYIVYDGVTVSNVTPYIPTISLVRKPDGTSSTNHEPLNLLGAGFKDSFTADGTSADYVLSLKGLDATTVTAVVNGTTITEGAGLTVNRTDGKVTFSVVPPAGLPDNVIITAYKTNSAGALEIKNCTKAIEFTSRMWFTGNPNYPNKLWKTGLTDALEANYFPASGYSSFEVIGGLDEAITGFVNHYNKLIIFKERSTWFTLAEQQTDGTYGFPIKRLNSQIGCDMPGTIQLIKNCPTFCNTYGGVYIITSTYIEDEKNVDPVSTNINGIPNRTGLLQETNLATASSHDDESKYYLCVDDKVYVWDYSAGFDIKHPVNLKWYYYDNINAKEFFILDNETLYTDRDTGMIKKFVNVQNDFGQPINGVWRSMLFDFGHPDYEKYIADIWLTTKANNNSSISIKYFNEDENEVDTITIPSNFTGSFSWGSFSWAAFSFSVQRFAKTIRKKVKQKKIVYFQIEVSNNALNENLSLSNLVIKYALTRRVK